MTQEKLADEIQQAFKLLPASRVGDNIVTAVRRQMDEFAALQRRINEADERLGHFARLASRFGWNGVDNSKFAWVLLEDYIFILQRRCAEMEKLLEDKSECIKVRVDKVLAGIAALAAAQPTAGTEKPKCPKCNDSGIQSGTYNDNCIHCSGPSASTEGKEA